VSAGPLVTEDILAFRMISDPRVSPDGGRVAFVLTEQNTEENRQLSTIWAVPSDGSEEARRLSQGTGRDARPRGVVIPFATLTKKALSSLSKRRTTACRAERGAQARETVGGRSTLGRRSARSSAVGLRWAAR